MSGVLETELTATVGEILIGLFLLIAAVVFIVAGLIALFEFGKALRNHPRGLLRYLRKVGPRFLAVSLGTILLIIVSEGNLSSLRVATVVTFGFYGWMMLLFSGTEARNYAPS